MLGKIKTSQRDHNDGKLSYAQVFQISETFSQKCKSAQVGISQLVSQIVYLRRPAG